MTSTIVPASAPLPPGGRYRECGDWQLGRPVTGTGDPTPVDDLEAWHKDYDPEAAGAFDRRLDAAFGPLRGAA